MNTQMAQYYKISLTTRLNEMLQYIFIENDNIIAIGWYADGEKEPVIITKDLVKQEITTPYLAKLFNENYIELFNFRIKEELKFLFKMYYTFNKDISDLFECIYVNDKYDVLYSQLAVTKQGDLKCSI